MCNYNNQREHNNKIKRNIFYILYFLRVKILVLPSSFESFLVCETNCGIFLVVTLIQGEELVESLNYLAIRSPNVEGRYIFLRKASSMTFVSFIISMPACSKNLQQCLKLLVSQLYQCHLKLLISRLYLCHKKTQ